MPSIVIGVSGGLDSTHALIVAAKACDRLGLPRTNILGFTMPGFATTAGTKANAIRLMEALGVTWEEIDIRPAARQMLADIGHPFARGEPVYDVTFENVQAGLRTDYLFRVANQRGGIVLGTGDLSELALGWCTYGVGDQMSHYNVNAGVPKTLIQHLIRWVGRRGSSRRPVNDTLLGILDTEITPRAGARPGRASRSSAPRTPIGPYALQDFNLYHVLRYGFRPVEDRVPRLARVARRRRAATGPPASREGARPAYDLADDPAAGWRCSSRASSLNQFKRSAMPNGPKVVAGGSLSPRGDWRMPSDAGPRAWLAELDANVPRS